MRKLVGLTLLAVFVVASVAGAATDPWRMRVTDYDKLTPHTGGAWLCEVIVDSDLGSWGSTGGTARAYWWWGGSPNSNGTGALYYTKSTGAMSFGATTATSIGWSGWEGGVSCRNVIKVGSVYKVWRWTGEYKGQDIVYATATDGATFGVPTRCTVYGPTVTSTGWYGHGGERTSGGVYMFTHRNSGAAYQSAGSQGVATSGVGETVWWDIDTGDPDPVMGGPYGFHDPIADPHTLGTYYREHPNYRSLRVACDGNLIGPTGLMNEYSQFGGYWEAGMGLYIGTAGQLTGGDHYVWLADADNANTQGIGDSLLAGLGLNGLGGPSLKNHIVGYWTGWVAKMLPLANGGQMAPSARFALIYGAAWDTDSSGGYNGYDLEGIGRALLEVTQNNADLNYDGTVNYSDIAPFSTAYGSTSGVSPNYNAEADFNKDGEVNYKDISPLSTRYGSDCSY